MQYINYFDDLPIDTIILNSKNNNSIRKYYRLFKLLGRYINAAIMQYNRINDYTLRLLPTENTTESIVNALEIDPLFSDIHFLLIAMDRCYSVESKLYKYLCSKSAATEFDKSKPVDDVRVMRNVFEHFENDISKTNSNSKYNLGSIYEENNWSWLEKQFGSIYKGVLTIKDRELIINQNIFSNILEHYHIIIKLIKSEINHL